MKTNESTSRAAREDFPLSTRSHAGQYRAQLLWSFLVALAVAIVALQQAIGPRASGAFRSTASAPQSTMSGIPMPDRSGTGN